MAMPGSRPLTIGLGIFAATSILSAVAYGYWTTAGTGSGSGVSATSQTVTATQINTVSTPIDMAPGGAAQYIDFQLTNPMATKQKVAAVTASITGVVYDSSWGADSGVTADGRHGDPAHACAAADLTLDTDTKTINAELNAGTTSYTGATSGL